MYFRLHPLTPHSLLRWCFCSVCRNVGTTSTLDVAHPGKPKLHIIRLWLLFIIINVMWVLASMKYISKIIQWRLQPSEMWPRVIWYLVWNVSEKSTNLKMKAAGSSEGLVPVYQTPLHHIPDDPNLCIHHHENLKSRSYPRLAKSLQP
jgi:hypothetical protein